MHNIKLLKMFKFANYELLSNTLPEHLILFDLLHSLKPGFYFPKKNWCDHGIFVSKNEENISFKVFSLKYTFAQTTKNDSFPEYNIRKIYSYLSPMIKFLKKFLKKYFYYKENSITIYDIGPRGHMFINHAINSMFWGYKRLNYKPTKKKYTLNKRINRDFKIFVRENRVIDVYFSNISLEFCMFKKDISKATIEPISLESFIMDQTNKEIKKSKIVLDFNFRLHQDDKILTDKEIVNYVAWFETNHSLSEEYRTIYKMLKIENEVNMIRNIESEANMIRELRKNRAIDEMSSLYK